MVNKGDINQPMDGLSMVSNYTWLQYMMIPSTWYFYVVLEYVMILYMNTYMNTAVYDT